MIVNLWRMVTRWRSNWGPVATALSLGGAAAIGVLVFDQTKEAYWAYGQPDPEIIERGTSYLHRGVNLERQTLQEWTASGHAADTWMPLPVLDVQAGEATACKADSFVGCTATGLKQRRDLQFDNKVLAKVLRYWECDGATPGTVSQLWLDPLDPPTRTETRTVKDLPIEVHPAAAGWCTYRASAKFYKNEKEREIIRYFQPIRVYVRAGKTP